MIWWIIGILVVLFGFTAFRGAPYVPTHRRQVQKALNLLNLKPGAIVVDLGSGDGVFLKAAAQRGLIVYGYEINPLLCAIAWLRCFKYRKQIHILWRDFWLTPLPKNTKGVFIFTAGPFLKKLNKKIIQEAKQQSFTIVSYGFEIPERKDLYVKDGLHMYAIEKT